MRFYDAAEELEMIRMIWRNIRTSLEPIQSAQLEG